jgi:ABC-type proline/glycine betaine transport system permease subunit
VTAGKRYLIGFALVGIAGAGLAGAAGPALRSDVSWGILLGLLVQAPLGWWTIRSIGSERFQLVWAAGMVIRLAVVAITGLVLVPMFGWRMVPALGALVTTLLALLLVEVVTALREHSGITER